MELIAGVADLTFIVEPNKKIYIVPKSESKLYWVDENIFRNYLRQGAES